MDLSSSQLETRTTEWFDTTHVVAIGVDRYIHPVSTLNNAVNDAVKIVEIFEHLKSGDKIEKHLFLSLKENSDGKKISAKHRKATKTAIENFLHNLQDKLEEKKNQKGKETDRLVFFFAGHGVANPITTNNDSSNSSSKSDASDNKPKGYLLL